MQVLIQRKIYEIRGQKVMLDFDLAELYNVETRTMNQAVKRNKNRFPKDFMFQLTIKEWKEILPMGHVLKNFNKALENSSQFVMSSLKHRGSAYLPYAFTEHGITMLASILKSNRAVKMNIAIVRAFIALREFAINYNDLAIEIKKLRKKAGDHDEQLKYIYHAIENLLDKRPEQRKWEERPGIGFKK